MYYVKNKYDVGSEINITIECDEEDTYDHIEEVYISYYDEDVYIDFATSIAPCLIRPIENETYLFMVLPVRLS